MHTLVKLGKKCYMKLQYLLDLWLGLRLTVCYSGRVGVNMELQCSWRGGQQCITVRWGYHDNQLQQVRAASVLEVIALWMLANGHQVGQEQGLDTPHIVPKMGFSCIVVT